MKKRKEYNNPLMINKQGFIHHRMIGKNIGICAHRWKVCTDSPHVLPSIMRHNLFASIIVKKRNLGYKYLPVSLIFAGKFWLKIQSLKKVSIHVHQPNSAVQNRDIGIPHSSIINWSQSQKDSLTSVVNYNQLYLYHLSQNVIAKQYFDSMKLSLSEYFPLPQSIEQTRDWGAQSRVRNQLSLTSENDHIFLTRAKMVCHNYMASRNTQYQFEDTINPLHYQVNQGRINYLMKMPHFIRNRNFKTISLIAPLVLPIKKRNGSGYANRQLEAGRNELSIENKKDPKFYQSLILMNHLFNTKSLLNKTVVKPAVQIATNHCLEGIEKYYRKMTRVSNPIIERWDTQNNQEIIVQPWEYVIIPNNRNTNAIKQNTSLSLFAFPAHFTNHQSQKPSFFTPYLLRNANVDTPMIYKEGVGLVRQITTIRFFRGIEKLDWSYSILSNPILERWNKISNHGIITQPKKHGLTPYNRNTHAAKQNTSLFSFTFSPVFTTHSSMKSPFFTPHFLSNGRNDPAMISMEMRKGYQALELQSSNYVDNIFKGVRLHLKHANKTITQSSVAREYILKFPRSMIKGKGPVHYDFIVSQSRQEFIHAFKNKPEPPTTQMESMVQDKPHAGKGNGLTLRRPPGLSDPVNEIDITNYNVDDMAEKVYSLIEEKFRIEAERRGMRR